MGGKEQKRVPELRFIGFVEDWEQRKLMDSAIFNPKSLLPDEFEYVDLESVVGIEMISHRAERKDQAPSRAQRLAKKGDIFYQTVRPYQKNNFLFDLSYDNYVFSTGYAQLRPVRDSYFLLSRLQEESFVSKVLDRSTGTSYPAINSNDLAQIEVGFPSKAEEETKIGSLFKAIDNVITLHERKLEQLKQLKQGFMQQMFPSEGENTPKMRFADFKGDWEQRRVSSMSEETFGGGTPKTGIKEYWNGDFPWIQSSDLKIDELNNVTPSKFITKKAIENSATKAVPKNSIAIVTRVGVGKLAFMPYAYATSQDFFSLSSLKVDSLFGIYSLYTLLQKEINNTQGTSIKGMTKSDLLDKNIIIPSNIDEQAKIGQLFNELDNTINLQESKIMTLHSLKKAFLQKMFI